MRIRRKGGDDLRARIPVSICAMNEMKARWAACALIALLPLGPAHAEDACAGFAWNVSHERALFASAPQQLAASAKASSAAPIVVDRLYQLQLVSQAQARFAVPSERPAPADTFAGILQLTVPEGGAWRISVDAKLWVDVVLDGHLLRAAKHQGQSGCTAPHKIVEFELPAGKTLTLQLSEALGPTARIAVTRTP
jgi:hypothetical protein